MKTGFLAVLVICAGPASTAGLVFEGGGQRLAAEIAEASPMFMHGAPSLSVRLNENSAAAFADLTEDLVGESLVVRLCGIDLVTAVVRERLAGNAIINMPDIQHAVAVAEVLQGEADCRRLEGLFVD